ncbi:MAG: 1-deoxy-D-xylulose-5-phosphate synthase [Actinomycetota bacterium]|nr:1-deoxy-D-xylulose-5-phosphate synthase [Actinomycetota bacterium]
MRKAFIRTLVEIARRDPRLVLLTGDLGFTVIEPFASEFPDRFLNAGVAEQNMVALATGMAESGFVPFVYSIATFATSRPYEFIRNGPAAQRLPVRIVGVGGGFDYGPAGYTHFALEDLALMRIQPGMTVIAPADHEQASSALNATWDLPGPIYFRIGKDDSEIVPGLGGRFRLGHPEEVRQGSDLLILATGSHALHAVHAADELADDGVESTVLIVSTLRPANTEELSSALSEYRVALSVEGHYVDGALGSLVAELIAECGLDCRLVRCGVTTAVDGVTGSSEYMAALHGLSPGEIAAAGHRALKEAAHP